MVGSFLLDACGTMPTELVTGSTHRYTEGEETREKQAEREKKRREEEAE